jgi:PAS domain S-box-containing protein
LVAGLDDERDSLIRPAPPPTLAQRQRHYFEAALQGSPVAIVMLDRDERILTCNLAFEQLFGYAQAEIVGHDLDTLITTEATHAEAVAYTRQAMEGLVHAVTQRRRKDGTPVEVELFGVPVTVAGETVGAVALYENITERKRAETWLRLANAALEAAANGIVICDREGRIVWVNPAFTRLTGYTREESLDQTMRLLKSGKHDPSFYQNLWETILAGRVWQGETINRRKDGSLYTEEQTIAPVRDERGTITHFISIKQDVSARKQADEELRRAKSGG